MLKRQLTLPQNHSFFLLGARQTGKSTLIHSDLPAERSMRIDLLDHSEYRRFSADPSLLVHEVRARAADIRYVVIDEVQRVPELLNEVHRLMEGPRAPIFAMSGSSVRKLKRGHANLLAGRAWSMHLHPLTHGELGGAFRLDRALALGTLPPIWTAADVSSARRTLRAYTETYLREEIQQEALVRNMGGFVRFLDLAADENGRIINYSALSRQCGVSYQTVKEFFVILQDTLVGTLLEPYAGSARRRLVAHPKFYFFDTGVSRALAGRLDVELAPRSREYGEMFEHFFILEAMRSAGYRESGDKFFFYRNSNGAEADLIVCKPDGRMWAVEIKSSDAPASADLSGLRSFAGIEPKAKLICACTAPRPMRVDGVEILPWQQALQAIA
jgi:uncharacterized protein